MQYHLNGFVPGDPDIYPPIAGLHEPPGKIPDKVDVLIAGTGPAGLCPAACVPVCEAVA